MSAEETKQIIQYYLKEVGSKYDPNIKVRPKGESKLLRAIRPFVELFNKNFWTGYITTIGTTIWHPEGWIENGDIRSLLQTVSHEVLHIKQSKKLTGPLFKFLYLFPQSLVVFSLFSFLTIGFGLNWLWCLLFLLCLAPIPAPFRYMFELEAYRVRLIFFEHVWNTTPEMKQRTKDLVIKNLSTADYYFTWPFPKTIQKHLDNTEPLKGKQYKELLDFLERHDLLKR